eukprot:TRINITY_DN8263_c0_g1_i2.p1 TRINITY_DN8263_c0_g1~~TRINITY_DN8263_c0_g1_i2.p1  ORF type:complete len:395 (-),score=23.22 TRINITY_DN8263_c0_g1_i2:759-1868(-)
MVDNPSAEGHLPRVASPSGRLPQSIIRWFPWADMRESISPWTSPYPSTTLSIIPSVLLRMFGRPARCTGRVIRTVMRTIYTAKNRYYIAQALILLSLPILLVFLYPIVLPFTIAYLIFQAHRYVNGVRHQTLDEFNEYMERIQQSWPSPPRHRRVTTPDGISLHVTVIGNGPRYIVGANGLGCRAYLLVPLIQWFADSGEASQYTLITWDYRGLFDSSADVTGVPVPRGRLSVRDLADDLITVLDAVVLGQDAARSATTDKAPQAVIMGWSTGVQVALQTAATYPDRVAGLVLISGTHGHTLQTTYQPITRIPGVGYLTSLALRQLRSDRFRFVRRSSLRVSVAQRCLPMPRRASPSLRAVSRASAEDI